MAAGNLRVPIKQETPCEFAHQIVHTFRPASPLPATTYGGSRASPSPPQPMAFSVSRGVVSPQPLVVPARLSSSPSELITISARLSPPGRSSAFSSAAGVPSPRSCSPSASGGGGGGGGGGGIFSPLRGVAHAAPANVAAFGPAGQQQAFATDVPDRASRLSFGPDCGAQPPTLLVGQPARWPEGGGLRRPVAISGAAPPSAGRADASRSYRMAQPTPPLPPSGHRSGLDASGQRTPSAYGAMPASGGAEVAGSKGSPGERPPFGPAGGRGATCGVPFGEAPAWNPAAVKEEPPDGDVFGIKEFSMLEDVSEIIRRDLNDLPAS
uniref:Translation initiation factor IF-2-like n=1 Tax=Petromyzon marinus TaxID=7757 RepID=A0AAJ7TGI4_PETMA|nr:translation initiation factor IF-2-like [Petromyzon marinus]